MYNDDTLVVQENYISNYNRANNVAVRVCGNRLL